MWQSMLALYFVCFTAMLVLYRVERRNHRRTTACYEALLGKTQQELAELRMIENGLRLDLAGMCRKDIEQGEKINKLIEIIRRNQVSEYEASGGFDDPETGQGIIDPSRPDFILPT